MPDLTLLGCWGDLKINAITDHCMLGHYPGPEYLQMPSACLSHISDMVMGQSDRRALSSGSDVNVLEGMKMLLWKWVLTAGGEAMHWVTQGKDGREPRMGNVPIKDEGDRLVYTRQDPFFLALLWLPLSFKGPTSALAQKLLFKNLVGLCYKQYWMSKLPFLGFILHWTAFPGETWTYCR